MSLMFFLITSNLVSFDLKKLLIKANLKEVRPIQMLQIIKLSRSSNFDL